MKDINSRYEVLYSDLRNHNIGEFLCSRTFKLFMNSIGEYETWKSIYKKVGDKRGYFIAGENHDSWDAVDTLALYFNALDNNSSELEKLLTQIIVCFIENIDKKTNFDDVIESAKMAKLREENIDAIKSVIEAHNNKDFPKMEEGITLENTNEYLPQDINNKSVFIVHGHNEEIKLNVARTLEKLGLNPIILNEQSNEGLTIIEKFEKYSNVGFAVILLTFDDYGNSKNKHEKNKRARQNVVLELGYFIAKLGRKNVMPLYEIDVELPSDISGVLYTIIDQTENWKIRLVKELKSAGFKIDANNII